MTETTRRKSFRGISVRLAVHYLTNLGGTERDPDEAEREHDETGRGDETERVVVGDGWTARLTATERSVGPSLSLTEVSVVFEGDAEEVDDVVERFSRKAMRAGG